MKIYSRKKNNSRKNYISKINGGKPLENEICKLIQNLENKSIVRSVAFHPSGNIVAFGSSEGTIKLWSINKYGILETNPLEILTEHAGDVNCLAFHPIGNILVSGTNKFAKLWKIEPDGSWNRTPPQGLVHNNTISSVAFNHSGNLLACGCYDYKVNLWRINTNGSAESKPCFYLTGHSAPVVSIAFHPTLNLLASGSFDWCVKLWNIKPNGYWDGIDLPRLGYHSNRVSCVAFSPNGKFLATGSWDKSIEVYKFKPDGTYSDYPETLRQHEGRVGCLAFHPSSNFLASGSIDNTVILWKINPNGTVDINPFQILRGHVSGIICLAFSSTGNILVTGSTDKTVKLWNSLKLSTHWPKLQLLTTGNLATKLITVLTRDSAQTLRMRLDNEIQKRIGIVPDTLENRKKQGIILVKKYQEFPRIEDVAPPQPSVALTHMGEHSNTSLEPRPRESLVQLQATVPIIPSILDTDAASLSVVCRVDDTDCNAVYDSTFWDIVKEMHISCSDRSEILKKIEELKGYRALLEKQKKPPGITSIWIKKLEQKITACKKQ